MSKRILLVAQALLFSIIPATLHSQQAPKEVSTLLADFRKEFTRAKEPTDKVLRTEAAKIAGKLVAEGKVDDAKAISTQVEDKIAGKKISATNPGLADLFALYDGALGNAAKPIRDRFSARVDALLRGNLAKDLTAVAALGEAKKIISGEMPAFESPTDPKIGGSAIASPARGRKVLSDLVEGKTWEFQTATGVQCFGFEKRGNRVRWLSTGSNARISEYNWSAEEDFVQIGDNFCEVRFDVGGGFGEVIFLSSKNRYRLAPSNRTIPAK